MNHYLILPARNPIGEPLAIAIAEKDVLSLQFYLHTMESLPIAQLVTEVDTPYWDVSEKFIFTDGPQNRKMTLVQEEHLAMFDAKIGEPTGRVRATLNHGDDNISLEVPSPGTGYTPLARFQMSEALALRSDSPTNRTHCYLKENRDRLVADMRDDYSETQTFEPVFDEDGSLAHIWIHERRFADPSELNLDEQGNHTPPAPSASSPNLE